MIKIEREYNQFRVTLQPRFTIITNETGIIQAISRYYTLPDHKIEICPVCADVQRRNKRKR